MQVEQTDFNKLSTCCLRSLEITRQPVRIGYYSKFAFYVFHHVVADTSQYPVERVPSIISAYMFISSIVNFFFSLITL
jgi:hypothetical protein